MKKKSKDVKNVQRVKRVKWKKNVKIKKKFFSLQNKSQKTFQIRRYFALFGMFFVRNRDCEAMWELHAVPEMKTRPTEPVSASWSRPTPTREFRAHG